VPERLDSVQIQLASQPAPLVISWAARDELIMRLEHHAAGAFVVEAFRDVGATSPVRLTIDQKELLAIVIDEWMRAVGRDELPADVFDLRNALINDLKSA
jgi:hypothetical protein